MVAVYLGVVEEDKINDMSIVFFNHVLAALGKRVNYDAVVNFAGNSFAKDAWKTIQESNPLIKHKSQHAFAQMFSDLPIKQPKIVPKEMVDQKLAETVNESVGDVTDNKDVVSVFDAMMKAVKR